VKLSAVARRGRSHRHGIAKGTLTLKGAGTKTETLRISRRNIRLLMRRGTFVQVLYRSGALAGIASAR
jgi:hypothetical protein